VAHAHPHAEADPVEGSPEDDRAEQAEQEVVQQDRQGPGEEAAQGRRPPERRPGTAAPVDHDGPRHRPDVLAARALGHPRPARRPAHPGDRRRPRRLPPGEHGRDAPDPPDLPGGHRPGQQRPAPPGGRRGRRGGRGGRPRPQRRRPRAPPPPHHPLAGPTPPLPPRRPAQPSPPPPSHQTGEATRRHAGTQSLKAPHLYAVRSPRVNRRRQDTRYLTPATPQQNTARNTRAPTVDRTQRNSHKLP